MKILDGEFATLRELTESDAEITFHWRMSERAKFLSGNPGTIENQKAWINSRPLNEFNFVILENLSQQPVGMLSLTKVDKFHLNAESSRFLIGDEERCKGLPIAAESMLLLYKFAFEALELHRVYGYVSSENLQMIKWQSYMGMKHEGIWRDHIKSSNGSFVDAHLFGINKVEFESIARGKLQSFLKMHQPRSQDGS
jgi:RimJ/RimL family protein N-acetyltransferase